MRSVSPVQRLARLTSLGKRLSLLQTSILASAFLVVALFSWSFSGPVNSGFDSAYHLGNIWCAHGDRSEICEIVTTENGQRSGKVPAELSTGIKSTDKSNTILAGPTTKSPYYSIMGFLVGKNVALSVLLMRVLSSILVGLIFFALIFLSTNRIRLAVVSAWTFTISPILIGTFWQSTPRSWGYLSVMSGWAFLYMALNEQRGTRRNYAQWILFFIACLLAFTSRKDASMFLIFTCGIVLLIHFFRNMKVPVKRLALLFGFFVSAFIVIRYFFSSIRSYTRLDISSIFENSRTVFVLVHLPENIADAFGLGLRYHDIGPNTIGIIGLFLFAYSLSSWLKNGNRISYFAVAFTTFFLFLVMFQISFNWPETTPATGVYTAALLPVILGFSAIYAESTEGITRTRSSLFLIISLLSFSHALTLYSKFEWSVRSSEVNDTYTRLSLDGSWWWNTAISPNHVYLIGVLAFPIWLFFSWSAVNAHPSE